MGLTLLVVAASSRLPAQQPMFGSVRLGTSPRSWGVVTMAGARLFTFSTAAGKLTPGDRARVVATRLETLYQAGLLAPGTLAVGVAGKQVVITCAGEAEPVPILTMDPALARALSPPRPAPQYAASWWAVLLEDYLAAARGQPPQLTVGVPALNRALSQLAAAASRNPGGGMEAAYAALARPARNELNLASARVPAGWQAVKLEPVTPTPAPSPPSLPDGQPGNPLAPQEAPPPAAAKTVEPTWKVERQESGLTITWVGREADLAGVEFILVDRNGDPAEVAQVDTPPFRATFAKPPEGAFVRVWATKADGNEVLTVVPATAK